MGELKLIQNKSIIFNQYVCVLKKDNRCILANRTNNKWATLSLEVYEILVEAIGSKLSVRGLLDTFEDKEDKQYLLSVLEKLLNSNIVVQDDRSTPVSRYEFVSLVLTNRCNLSCIHCCADANSNIQNAELTTDEWMHVISVIKSMGIKNITITGGEPLIREDIERISKYLRKNFKGNLTLMTNGLLINTENVDYLTDIYDHISISIDGCNKEMTSFIRGEGTYEKVIQTIKFLKDRHFENISLSAILPNSLEVEKEFENLCESLNVKAEIRYFSKRGRGGKNYRILAEEFQNYISKNNYHSYIFEEHEDVADLRSCSAIRGATLTIGPQGLVFPCNLLQDNQFGLGTIDSIKLENEKLKQLYNFKGTICENCCVNVFCWSCISDYESMRHEESMLKERCNIKKKNLIKRIWGEN